jgi:hypothetical protein
MLQEGCAAPEIAVAAKCSTKTVYKIKKELKEASEDSAGLPLQKGQEGFNGAVSASKIIATYTDSNDQLVPMSVQKFLTMLDEDWKDTSDNLNALKEKVDSVVKQVKDIAGILKGFPGAKCHECGSSLGVCLRCANCGLEVVSRLKIED